MTGQEALSWPLILYLEPTSNSLAPIGSVQIGGAGSQLRGIPFRCIDGLPISPVQSDCPTVRFTGQVQKKERVDLREILPYHDFHET